MVNRPLTRFLASGTSYSAPVALENSRQFLLELLLLSASADPTDGITITPQYTIDLNNWVDDVANLSTSSNKAPYRMQKIFNGPAVPGDIGANPYDYVRLKVVNEDATTVLLTVWLRGGTSAVVP